MTIRIHQILGTLTLCALLAAGCASSGKSSGGSTAANLAGAVAGSDTAKAAIAALAAKIGVSENYVSLALTAAQGLLGSGKKTAEEKATAAQGGVDKAAAQAASDGKAFTEEQKTGLFEGLKNLL
ncbi:MAG TPA: hypothetical protein VH877_14425 [Polyangia bacterium]|nr:hypothetical protein [Polyangia bacterium]